MAELPNKLISMKDNDFKKICETFERTCKAIKKFHDQIMKRKNFFALRMGQLRFQGWEQKASNYWQPKIKQKDNFELYILFHIFIDETLCL